MHGAASTAGHVARGSGRDAAGRARALGGYYAWFRIFDNKLNRRKSGEYAEQYTHDGDSCGIHSSGAGFPRMDPADQWVPPAFE